MISTALEGSGIARSIWRSPRSRATPAPRRGSALRRGRLWWAPDARRHVPGSRRGARAGGPRARARSIPTDAIVRVEASGICGSDLHIYHGRVPVEPGFTIGHEFVGTVLAVGDEVERVAVGDRVLGCFHTACGTCFCCIRGDYPPLRARAHVRPRREARRSAGRAGRALLVPHAEPDAAAVPEGMSADVALFAGDVMGTGYHAVAHAGMRAGRHRRPCSASGRWGCAPCRPRAPRRDAGVRDRHRRPAPGDGRDVRRARPST